MTAPLRVLQVVGALGMGGAETWLMEALRLWSRSGQVQMDFLLTSAASGFFDDEARALGAQLHYIRYGRAQLPAFTRAFREVLRHGAYDAIHEHSDYASGWRFALGAGALPPVRVAHVHNPWLHITANYAVSPTRRMAAAGGKALVNRLATHVCGTSAQALREYGFEPGRTRGPSVCVVHCGFDPARYDIPRDAARAQVLAEFGWPPQTKLVLFAGRLDRALEFTHPQNHKNSWFALNVVKAAIEHDPTVRLVMAGAGESRETLQSRVSAWGLADQLRLVGVRDDLPVLMRAADVLLFPSAQEGLGMVAVEAQAAGLPVLASTAVPREAVVIPELYEARGLDEPIDGWAQALLTSMTQPRMSLERTQQTVGASHFSIGASARRLAAIYGGAR